jgi:uncharacterized protein (DUF488 family)
MGATREILTIGHSTHDPAAFVELLRGQRVELLIDVRRHPGSRRVPWTNRDRLRELLAQAAVGYLHLPSLGGRRRPVPGSPNGGWRVAQFQGYADHLASEEFREGLRIVEREAEPRRAALMCAEAQWWRCHRRLIADVLTVRGWRVCHLDAGGGLQEHLLTEFAVIGEGALTYPPGPSG